MAEGPQETAVRKDRFGISFERRLSSISPLFSSLIKISSIFAALFIILILIAAIGKNPLTALIEIFRGSLGSPNSIAEMLMKASPLMLSGCAIAFAWKVGIFNIGGEGQILFGGLGAFLAIMALGSTSFATALPFMLLGGFVFGGALGGLIGILRAKFGANEVVVSIMFNFIIVFLVSYLVDYGGLLHDPTHDFPQSRLVPAAMQIPIIWPGTRLHAFIILAVLTVVISYLVLYKTHLGFDIRATGQNPRCARYSGIGLVRVSVIALFLSGGLMGITGAGELGGVVHVLRTDLSPGYGFYAIVVALSAGLNPLGIILTSILFATVINGAQSVAITMNVPIPIKDIFIALAFTFVLAVVIFERYKIRRS